LSYKEERDAKAAEILVEITENISNPWVYRAAKTGHDAALQSSVVKALVEFVHCRGHGEYCESPCDCGYESTMNEYQAALAEIEGKP
jgi:hypothetical protein